MWDAEPIANGEQAMGANGGQDPSFALLRESCATTLTLCKEKDDEAHL